VYVLGKVDCISQKGGIEFYFNTEDHYPVHVHVRDKGGKWEIRVYFLECTKSHLEFDFKFPPCQKKLLGKYKKMILKQISNKKDLLLREWEDKVNIETSK
jgi:hypothetical protein